MKLPILKCHGTGNDFVLIDELRVELFVEHERQQLARMLCDRSRVVGADGVLFVLASSKADAKMRMFNPDGSEPQTCGNGLRCVARFMAERLGRNTVTIETMRTLSVAERVDELLPGVETFAVDLSPISLLAANLPLVIPQQSLVGEVLGSLDSDIRFTALSAPNPHLVAFVDRIDSQRLLAIGERVERLPALLPERANVSFCKILGHTELAIETYERGAGITLSCGSATASATVAACVQGLISPDEVVRVFSRGGFVSASAYRISEFEYGVRISGNATFVYDTTINTDLPDGTLPAFVEMNTRIDEISAYGAISDVAGRVFQES